MASDIGVNQKYLSSELYQTQKALDQITSWTQDNLMKLNEAKCHYMIFTRSKTDFTTRLKVNDQKIEQKSICKLLGVWISEDLSWSQNCQQICKKAYSRLSMLTKLKYVGVSVEDLLNIYIAKLSTAQSNSNSVGWAEIALSSTTPTTPPHPTPPYPPLPKK